MKKLIVSMMAAAAVLSCTKNVEEGNASFQSKEVELRINVPMPVSKASGLAVEDAVESVQAFVFDKQGLVLNSAYASGSSLTLTCSTGERVFAALVNAPEYSGVNSLEALQNLYSEFSDNSPGKFVMAGSCDKTVQVAGAVDIPVRRIVSKVVLEGITNNFTLPEHQNMDFVVNSVSIVNGADSKGFFGGLFSKSIAESCDLLYESLADIPVSYGATEEFGNYLYCYAPDPELPAYLVVGASLDGTDCYYPVPLPAMESNKCYKVSLTVTMPGSSSPDIPVSKENAGISVTVSEWSENIDVNETI